jgi:protein-disulfide isomerase
MFNNISSFKKIVRYFTIFVIGVVGLSQTACAQSTDEAKESESSESKAEVTITEYGDYQCPACGYYHKMVKQLKQEFGDKLEVEFHHFPLGQHQYAALAARAAEAARNQGKFWEMHNKLYANQKEWSSGNATQTITRYAKTLELDMEQFNMDLNARATQQRVMKDKKQGVEAGVNSTPTFFINGDKVSPMPRTYEAFKKHVTEAMNAES